MMPSWPQLLILIVVIVLLFGTKKLRSLGSDLGASIKGFKKAMQDDDAKDPKGLPKFDEHQASDNDNTKTKPKE